MECPGFVPDPEKNYTLFIWYKARLSDKHVGNRVAVYDKSANLARIMGDMEGRASINRTSGALEIPETRITDGHYYTCDFRDTARGLITSETKLIITGKVLIAHSGVQLGGGNYCPSFICQKAIGHFKTPENSKFGYCFYENFS